MTWKIEFTRAAAKARERLPQAVRERILHALQDLAVDPYASRQVKALQGRDEYRLRVGEYRVLYMLENERLVVFVVRIAPRGSAY